MVSASPRIESGEEGFPQDQVGSTQPSNAGRRGLPEQVVDDPTRDVTAIRLVGKNFSVNFSPIDAPLFNERAGEIARMFEQGRLSEIYVKRISSSKSEAIPTAKIPAFIHALQYQGENDEIRRQVLGDILSHSKLGKHLLNGVGIDNVRFRNDLGWTSYLDGSEGPANAKIVHGPLASQIILQRHLPLGLMVVTLAHSLAFLETPHYVDPHRTTASIITATALIREDLGKMGYEVPANSFIREYDRLTRNNLQQLLKSNPGVDAAALTPLLNRQVMTGLANWAERHASDDGT